MNYSDFDLDMDELSTAEEFLGYFEIEYQPEVVHVNRLHILQRFHDYLQAIETMPQQDEDKYKVYQQALLTAYGDFVTSDAKTEKVFKVFKMMEPAEIMVPLSELLPGAGANAAKV